MKRLVVVIALLFPAPTHALGLTESPCADSLFVAYRAQPADSLTPAEFRYLIRREADCAKFQERARVSDGRDSIGPRTKTAIGVGALAVIAALMLAIAH